MRVNTKKYHKMCFSYTPLSVENYLMSFINLSFTFLCLITYVMNFNVSITESFVSRIPEEIVKHVILVAEWPLYQKKALSQTSPNLRLL